MATASRGPLAWRTEESIDANYLSCLAHWPPAALEVCVCARAHIRDAYRITSRGVLSLVFTRAG